LWGLSMDDCIWDPTVFTKNRDRLLRGQIALLDARLMTKGGQEAKLYFMGHVVMENRHGLRVRSKGSLPRLRCYFSYSFQNELLQAVLEVASWLRPLCLV